MAKISHPSGYARQMIESAYADYLGARALLLHEKLAWQGFILASVSVEKYLKACMTLAGVEPAKFHLSKWRAFKPIESGIEKAIGIPISDEFLDSLGWAYQFRYYDGLGQNRGCGFFRWQALAELDKTANLCEQFFMKKGRVATRYRSEMNSRDKYLHEENWVASGGGEDIYLRPGLHFRWVREGMRIFDSITDISAHQKLFVGVVGGVSPNNPKAMEWKFSHSISQTPGVAYNIDLKKIKSTWTMS